MSFSANGSNNETGGEYKHQLSVAEMPSHNHSYNKTLWVQDDGYGNINPSSSTGANKANILSSNSNKTGGDGKHNNIQPYITVYFWRRAA